MRRSLLLLVVPVLVLSACTAPNPDGSTSAPPAPATATASPPDSTPSSPPTSDGETATWELLNPDTISAESRVLELAVTRLDCANGITGDVLAPRITYEAEQILIRVDVAPLPSDETHFSCVANDAVPITVELREAIGERTLIDQACSDSDATATTPCITATRWP